MQWRLKLLAGPSCSAGKGRAGEPMAALSHWENAKVGCPSSETCKTNNNRKHSLPWVQAWQSPCNEEDEVGGGGVGGRGSSPGPFLLLWHRGAHLVNTVGGQGLCSAPKRIVNDLMLKPKWSEEKSMPAMAHKNLGPI